ncbi:MAG: hypothetical protein HY537_15610 [Deltaproteobacteria bacterium]|nr:hypothetical protein [Deltaproteobacteria bacterium]
MDSVERKGFEIWVRWTGLSSDSLPRRFSSSVLNQFSRLSQTVLEPPSQNATGYEPILEASADRQLWSLSKEFKMSPLPFWPAGQPYAVCVTHDIDRVFSTIHRLSWDRNYRIDTFRSVWMDFVSAHVRKLHDNNPFCNFYRTIRLEKQWGIPSVCYVLFEKRRLFMAIRKREPQHFFGVYRPEEIVRELEDYRDAGNEIGIHGSFDSWCNADALSKELNKMRNCGFSPVCGVRNHYLNFSLEQSPAIQQAAGLMYDSSLGFNFTSGFRSGTGFPFWLGAIWELPFQLMDSSLRFQYRAFADRRQVALKVLDEIKRVGGVLVLNWHLHRMNEQDFPDDVGLLEEIVSIAKKDGAWFSRPCDVITHWTNRGAVVKKVGETL